MLFQGVERLIQLLRCSPIQVLQYLLYTDSRRFYLRNLAVCLFQLLLEPFQISLIPLLGSILDSFLKILGFLFQVIQHILSLLTIHGKRDSCICFDVGHSFCEITNYIHKGTHTPLRIKRHVYDAHA